MHIHIPVYFIALLAVAILLQMKNNKNVNKAIEIDHCYKRDPSMRANL